MTSDLDTPMSPRQADWNARIDYGTYYSESETQK